MTHEAFEELISVSLSGELSPAERRQLTAHLRTCAACRATLAAFTEGRRLVAGLHYRPPPRDLYARVRTGIEGGGGSPVPWWRRPAAVFAGVAGGSAVLAGALLAIVLLNPQREAPVGQTDRPSPTVSVSGAATTITPTPDPLASITPTPSAAPTSSPGVTPVPAPTPQTEPDTYLALVIPTPAASPGPTATPQAPSLEVHDGASGEATATLPPVSGPPIAAAAAPDSEWLAYVAQEGSASGMVNVTLARATDGEGRQVTDASVQGSVFLEQMAWSPEGRWLAFAMVTDEQESDVYVVDTEAESGDLQPRRLTSAGRAVVGSFDADGGLWVSLATEEPVSHLLPADLVATGSELSAEDMAAGEDVLTLTGWFQPLLSPDGTMAIAWQGRFPAADVEAGEAWAFSDGGAPYLITTNPAEEGATDEPVPLFGDLDPEEDSISSAALTWGPDSRAIAAWDVRLAGAADPSASPDSSASPAPTGDAGEEELYPDPLRVYFGRATHSQPITANRALDAGDLPDGIARVIDVALASDGRHLAITVAYPLEGELDTPRADLILVKRNYGSQPDESRNLVDSDGWEGPAVYPRIAAEEEPAAP